MAGDLRRPGLSLAVARRPPCLTASVSRAVGPAKEGDVSSMAPAGLTRTQIVITVVTAVVVFVAFLVLVLKLSRRADRRREPGGQRLRPGSFGSDDEEDNAGAPGYGRPAGCGPPPLWTDTRYDPRCGRR
jgi:hypothetical protein